ncbi:hypothetical protein HNY73_002015 [Argiope bruennichi]|uniref:Uncharacterized protein n=1 Tax=Argiope bruennichi TaxID=94029 RepID=A0A8T0FWP6_ARGBR|nr:hypothetical protein HNY73_002015 [Argiope bruennichi]
MIINFATVLFVLGLLALCVSGMCVMSSALLLVGLCADNRTFLIPWLVCVSTATLLDVFLCVYFSAEDAKDRFHSALFITDFFFSAVNIYCLLCVLSQYQEYSAGRGRPEDCIRMQVLNRVPADEEKVPTESRIGNLVAVSDHPIESTTEFLQAPESINSSASLKCIVEICHNESFSENTTSVLSAEGANESV